MNILVKALPVFMIIAVCVLIALIGNRDGRFLFGKYVASYAASMCCTPMIYRFLPRLYDFLESANTYFAENFGCRIVFRYEISSVNSLLNMFLILLALYFVAASKRWLLAVVLFPVIVVMQIFVAMFSIPAVADGMKAVFYGIVYAAIALGVLSILTFAIRMRIKFSPSFPFAKGAWPKGMKPDLKGTYVREDGKKYSYVSDSLDSNMKLITVADDEGNRINLNVDDYGRLRGWDGKAYSYYPPGY